MTERPESMYEAADGEQPPERDPPAGKAVDGSPDHPEYAPAERQEREIVLRELEDVDLIVEQRRAETGRGHHQRNQPGRCPERARPHEAPALAPDVGQHA